MFRCSILQLSIRTEIEPALWDSLEVPSVTFHFVDVGGTSRTYDRHEVLDANHALVPGNWI